MVIRSDLICVRRVRLLDVCFFSCVLGCERLRCVNGSRWCCQWHRKTGYYPKWVIADGLFDISWRMWCLMDDIYAKLLPYNKDKYKKNTTILQPPGAIHPMAGLCANWLSGLINSDTSLKLFCSKSHHQLSLNLNTCPATFRVSHV